MADSDSRGYYYSKKCWCCGGFKLEDKGTYVQCRACGATWNFVPSLGFDPLTDLVHYSKNREGVILVRARQPSKSAFRAAAKARAQK